MIASTRRRAHLRALTAEDEQSVRDEDFGHDDPELWDHTGIRWVQEGPATQRPWCASSLEYSDSDEYEASFWMQIGWWEKPNIFQIREASHKAALERLFDEWEDDIRKLFPGAHTPARGQAASTRSIWRRIPRISAARPRVFNVTD